MKRRAVTVLGPPSADPSTGGVAVLVEQSRTDPHAAQLHVTGTSVCCNNERLPRNVRQRNARVEAVAAAVHPPRTGPVEVPWPPSAFTSPWPYSEAVMRLLVAAAQSNGNQAALDAAFRLYMSPRTTTPLQRDVVCSLLGGNTSCDTAGGFQISGIAHESPGLNFIVRTALRHCVVLALPHSVTVPQTVAFYDGFIRCIMREAASRIAARYAGTGPQWPAEEPRAAVGGSGALLLANEIGLLKLTREDRRRHVETMLGPKSRFRGLGQTMQPCYSENRQFGFNCVACPLTAAEKQTVCDAASDDKPAIVWARHAACSGKVSVASLAATVPPCVGQFAAMRDLTYRRRQDVANIIKVVSAELP